MDIRTAKKEEQMYTFGQNGQTACQTGYIGCFSGTFQKFGRLGFYESWKDSRNDLKTASFVEEREEIMDILHSQRGGLLENISSMRGYVDRNPEGVFQKEGAVWYGFRIDTDDYSYLLRCSPESEECNFFCACYVKKWLDGHVKNARAGIRFIDSRYQKQFMIADGEGIIVKRADGRENEYICRYIDEYHTEVGGHLYHICQFAEIMEKNGSSFRPADGARKPEDFAQPEEERERSR